MTMMDNTFVSDNRKAIKLNELCYIIFFELMFLAKAVGLYDGQTAYKAILVTSVIFFCAKMLLTEYTWPEFAAVLLLLLFGMVIYRISGEKGLLLCIMVVTGMKGVSVKKVFRISMWVWGIAVTGTVLFYLTHLSMSDFRAHQKLGTSNILRWSLGYSHPNILHITYFVLTALIVYNLGKRYSFRDLGILMAGNLYIFLYSISYTGVLITAVYLICALAVVRRDRMAGAEKILAQLIFPLCVTVSLLSPVILPEKLFNIGDKIFNHRLQLAKVYMIPEYMKLFGNNLAGITTSIYTMDNAYVFMFVVYGIVAFAIVTGAYLIIIHRYIMEDRRAEAVMMIVFLAAGITEPFLFNTSFKNITLLFLGELIYGESVREGSIKLLSGMDRYIYMPVRGSADRIKTGLCETFSEKKNKIIIAGITAGIVLLVLYMLNYVRPSAIIVPRTLTDGNVADPVFLKSASDPAYPGAWILHYTDQKTQMQVFTGRIITLEYIRGCISTVIWGTAAAGLAVTAIYTLSRRNSNER